MRRTVLGAALAGFASLGLPPAYAATSAITDAFVAGTTPAYEALRRSDGLALGGAGSARLQAFARRDDAAEAAAAEALLAWEESQRRADIAAAHAPSIDGLGPILYPFDTTVFPIIVHGRKDTDAYRAALAQLGAAQGTAFDDLYIDRQAATLRRLIEIYVDYIKNGDDPGLRALSVRNLPRARRLLAELARL